MLFVVVNQTGASAAAKAALSSRYVCFYPDWYSDFLFPGRRWRCSIAPPDAGLDEV